MVGKIFSKQLTYTCRTTLVLQGSMFQCLVCVDRAYAKYYQVKNHLLEYHSGIGYYCEVCDKTFPRRLTHLKCPAKPQDLVVCHRESQKKGEEAEEILNHYRFTIMPSHWREHSKSEWEVVKKSLPNPKAEFHVPAPISPLRHSPLPRKSPLERVDPGKPPMTYCRTRKRPSSTASATPPCEGKRTRTVQEDLGQEPMDILDYPLGFQPLKPNPAWKGVHFDPPIKVTTNLSDSSSEDDDDFIEVPEPEVIMSVDDILAKHKNHKDDTDENNNNRNDKDINKKSQPTVKSKVVKVDATTKTNSTVKSSTTKTTESKNNETKPNSTKKQSKTTESKSKTTENPRETSESENKSTKAQQDTHETTNKPTNKQHKTLESKNNSNEDPQKRLDNKSKTSDIQPKTCETKNKSTDTQPKTCETKSKSTETQPKTCETKAKSTNAQTKTCETKNKSTDTQPKTCETKSKSTETQPKTCETKNKSTDVQPKTSETKKTQQKTSETKIKSTNESKTTKPTKPRTISDNKNSKDNSETTTTTNYEHVTDTRRVELKATCPRMPVQPDTEVQSGHIDLTIVDDRPTVTIPGSMSTEAISQPRPSTRLDSSMDIQPFIMEEGDCRAFLADNIRLRHPTSTALRSATPRPIDMPRRLAEELSSNILRHLQHSQEEQLILRIGERDFCTSRVTLRADSESIFAAMLEPDSPFRPYGRNMYFIDRDSTHFRLILMYLRNGAHIDAGVLPDDRRSLLELLVEARFYMCQRLQEIICEKLQQVTGSKDQF